MANASTGRTWSSPRGGLVQGARIMTITLALAGTGGNASVEQLAKLHGTGAAGRAVYHPVQPANVQGQAIEVGSIRDALRLSVAELAQLFGTTRPTIYSWLANKPTKPENAHRIREVAAAVENHLDLLIAQGGRAAHRAIEGRTTLLQHLAAGAPAAPAMARLAEILVLEKQQRERLVSRLRGRSGGRGEPDVDGLG